MIKPCFRHKGAETTCQYVTQRQLFQGNTFTHSLKELTSVTDKVVVLFGNGANKKIDSVSQTQKEVQDPSTNQDRSRLHSQQQPIMH